MIKKILCGIIIHIQLSVGCAIVHAIFNIPWVLSKQIFENGPHFSKLPTKNSVQLPYLKKCPRGFPYQATFCHSSVTRHDIDKPFEVLKGKPPWLTLTWVMVKVMVKGQSDILVAVSQIGREKIVQQTLAMKVERPAFNTREIIRSAKQAKKSSLGVEFNCLCNVRSANLLTPELRKLRLLL